VGPGKSGDALNITRASNSKLSSRPVSQPYMEVVNVNRNKEQAHKMAASHLDDRKIPRDDSPPQLMLLNPRSLMHQTEDNTITGNTKTRGTACMRCRKLKVHCTGSLPW